MAISLDDALKKLGLSINVISSGKLSKPTINMQRDALNSILDAVNGSLESLITSLTEHSKKPSTNLITLQSVANKSFQTMHKINTILDRFAIDKRSNPDIFMMRELFQDLEKVLASFQNALLKFKNDPVKLGNEMTDLSRNVGTFIPRIEQVIDNRKKILDDAWTAAPNYL